MSDVIEAPRHVVPASILAAVPEGSHARAVLLKLAERIEDLTGERMLEDARVFDLANRKERLAIDKDALRFKKESAQIESRVASEAALVTSHLKRRREKAAAVNAKLAPLFALERACHQLANQIRVGGIKVKFGKPVDAGELALDQVRSRLDGARAELSELKHAPRTLAEVKAALDRYLAEHAAAPALNRMFDRSEMGMSVPYFPAYLDSDGRERGPDAFGMFLWLHGSEFKKRLYQLAEQIAAADRHALDDATLAQKLAEQNARIFELERIEAALIWEAIDNPELTLREISAPAMLAVEIV